MLIAGLTQGTAILADVTFTPKNNNYTNDYKFTSNCNPVNVHKDRGNTLVKCSGPETTITGLAKNTTKNTTCKIVGGAPSSDECKAIIFKISGHNASGFTITLN